MRRVLGLAATAALLGVLASPAASAHIGSADDFYPCPEPGLHVHVEQVVGGWIAVCARASQVCLAPSVCASDVCAGAGFDDLGPWLWVKCTYFPLPPR